MIVYQMFFGRDDLGATGVAGGVERIILRLDAQGISCTTSNDTISVVYVNDELKSKAIQCASKLRKLGISTNIDLTAKSIEETDGNVSKLKILCYIRAQRIFREDRLS